MSFFKKSKLKIKTNEQEIVGVHHENVSEYGIFLESLKNDVNDIDFNEFIQEAASRVRNKKRISSVFVSGCNADPCDYIYIALDKNNQVSIANKENDKKGELFLSFVNGFESGDYVDVCRVTLEDADI